ncbi:hypothetical protein TNCV_3957971 [Trichonephila clavipes]|nr:hypothetical protein TNCV_3957971 [Trichonephila clavipes]
MPEHSVMILQPSVFLSLPPLLLSAALSQFIFREEEKLGTEEGGRKEDARENVIFEEHTLRKIHVLGACGNGEGGLWPKLPSAGSNTPSHTSYLYLLRARSSSCVLVEVFPPPLCKPCSLVFAQSPPRKL